MAVRQYIGARYVTKIYQNSQDAGSCEWEAGVVYEPLTIVEYQNSSYLSRSEVPANAGNPATATQYWAQTGFYNGQIAQLQNDVDDINNNIGDLDELPTTDKDSIVDAITELDSKTMPKKFKHVICIGDSWGGTDCWPDKLNAMGFSSGTFQKEVHGGTGFQTGNPTFEQAIANMTPTVDANLVDCVVIIGGTNDQSNLSTLPTAIGNTVTAAKTKFPNAKIYVGFNLHLIVGFSQIDATEVEGAVEVEEAGGCPLTGLSFNQRFCKIDWNSDNWHLDNYTYFARMIYSGIYCGTIDVPRILNEADLGISTTVIRNAKASYKNGYCYLTISLNPAQTFAVLDHIIPVNEIAWLNLHGKTHQSVKSSTSNDILDLIIENGIVDTFLGGTIATYPATFTIISHHGNIVA